LSGGHARHEIRDDSAKSVKHEAFDRVVVQGSVGIRNVEPVVARV
jgi:hypothetical protein